MCDKIYKKKIKEYCINEGEKKTEDIKCKYKERLDKYIKDSVYEPACIYTNSEEVEGIWFKPTDIILRNGFTFYHHSPEEILQFSLKKRSEYKFLISQMNESQYGNILDLKEYPAPFTDEKLYMVRLNGNHRAGVFRTIGLPFVTARIEKPKSNNWRYCSPINPYFIEKLLKLFEKMDLLKEIKEVNFCEYEITPKIGLAIWILPGSYCKSIFSIIKDIRTRIKMIENLYPDSADKIPKILKSKLLLIHMLTYKKL